MNMNRIIVVAAMSICVTGCANGVEGVSAATTAAPASSSAAHVVEPNAHGVFFDRRPIVAELDRVARLSRPTAAALQRVPVVDAKGFGQPMTAMSIEVPAGWITRGGVEWDRNVECLAHNYATRWSAASPDGLHEVALMPRLSWQVRSHGIVPLNPCPAAPDASVHEYLVSLMHSARPGAREISYRDRPDIVAATQAGAQQGNGSNRIRHEAGELLIGYALNGQEMRETLIVDVNFSESQGTVQANAETAFALRAPDGLLDFAVADRMRQSMRMERAWGDQMLAWSGQRVAMLEQNQVASIQAWHQRRMSEISTAGILARGRIRQETIADLGRINNQIVASQSASSDRQQAAVVDMIQEVQPWRDPGSGQQVDLSIHYQHAWQLDDGRQFLTNDASLDPARDLGIGGHALQPVR
ncbi:MAG: hypothetical protein ABIR62_07810 [Dokdonella sp.]|uniref:hypothetical protein n=1 Tax=Dokdonella sp. TaxID=2291710 RepID=UPI003265D970